MGGERKIRVPGEENLAGDGRRKPTLKKDAGVNVPERRRLLVLKRFVTISGKLFLMDKAVLTQETEDLLK